MLLSKRIVAVVLSIVCLLSIGVITNAATKDFNVTASNVSYVPSTDPWTKRATKAGGSSYENKFYVRTNTMSGTCSYISFYAKNMTTSYYYSTPLTFYRTNLTNLIHQTYDASAPSGNEYALCMQPEYGYANINATGRFTP